MEEKGLSPKRSAFVNEFLKDFNGTQAAIRAGYAPKAAQEQAARLLSFAMVKAEIQRRQEEAAEKTGATVERILLELCRIAFFDDRRLYNEDGSFKKPSEWDDDVAAVIGGSEVVELFGGSGKDREQIGYLKKVKKWDKNKALEMLGRYRQMWRDEEKKPQKVVVEVVQFGDGGGKTAIAVKVES